MGKPIIRYLLFINSNIAGYWLDMRSVRQGLAWMNKWEKVAARLFGI